MYNVYVKVLAPKQARVGKSKTLPHQVYWYVHVFILSRKT